MCTSASTAWRATSSGRLEQRADVDVEAEVGERGGDHLLAAVVAVLAHLGDQDARPAALGLARTASTSARTRSTSSASSPDLVAVHAGDRTDRRRVPAVHLLQRVGDLADRGLGAGGVDRQLQQVALDRAAAASVERVERRRSTVGLVALGPQPLAASRSAGARTARVVDLEHVDLARRRRAGTC